MHPALNEALARIQAALGRDVRLLQARIHADRLILQARDPSRSDRVLEHVVKDGVVSSGVAVDLKGPGQLEDNLFALSDVRLATLPEVCSRALERVDSQAGRIHYVLVRRNLPSSMDVRFRVYVSSPIRDGIMDADAEGRPLEEERACPRDAPNGHHEPAR